MASHTCCCCEGEVCLKSGTEPLCCCCCALRCVEPTVCIKVQSQFCCIAHASALPCDKEMQCLVGLCGLVCCPRFACCKTLGEIADRGSVDQSAERRAWHWLCCCLEFVF